MPAVIEASQGWQYSDPREIYETSKSLHREMIGLAAIPCSAA